MKDFFTGDVGYDEHPQTSAKSVMAHTHFLHLVGGELDYYGADTADNTFKVDGIIFKVIEDHNDGYRSMLGMIDYTDEHSSLFFQQPIARVAVVVYDTGEDEISPADYGYGEWSNEARKGYRLVDIVDGHIWLEFGTHNYDDYYPCFAFRHFAKERS